MKTIEILEKMEKEPGYFNHNNYHILKATEENIELRADLTENSMNPYNIAHGGFIFGLGDTAMGVAASSTGKNAVTLSATINYLKPSTGKYLIAEAEVIKSGKKICYLQTNIYNDNEELVATMDSNYCYVK